MLSSVKAAADSLRLQLQVHEAREPGQFDGAFAAMARGRAGALLVFGDPMFFLQRARLAELALKNRLASMSTQWQWVEAGGLIAYGPSLPDLWRRAATHVDKILKGARPADLPVEQPTRFELVINMKTAKALGRTIPPSMLVRADEIIE
jgi:putative ABC transport system substrate-binding protein